MNRLGSATSPYLLQHADNPVEWWPWGAEAAAEAKRRDLPLLISVGYAACHWCHVMAHESFENEQIAALVNVLTVPVKVDREERPDVDAVYMSATQAMTGQGGWPMTVFATPDGQPFYCGTYFPPGQFAELVQAIGAAWRDQRALVLRQGAAVVEAIGAPRARTPSGTLTPELLDEAARSLHRAHDPVHGGLGGAPKFPPHLEMLFLLRHHQRTGDRESLEVVAHTAEAMARGGIYDQVGGGFARYSVDEKWLVPHFEKMLYDNALLLRVYTQLWRLTGDDLAARVAGETVDFLLRDMSTPEGGLASALDADTAGVEGATYVWTPEQLRDALGQADGDWAADLFDVTPAGSFEHGTSVLRLARDLDSAAGPAAAGQVEQQWERWQRVRAGLFAARTRRPQPARDDKVIAAWNGLAITALVEYAMIFAESRPEQAARAGEFAADLGALLERVHLVPAGDGQARLRRVSRGGVAGEPAGVLDDYGCLAEAYCLLHQLTTDGRWLDLAGALVHAALAHFADGDGGFYDTADDAESLVTRPADPTDNATPSGQSSIAAALLGYGVLAGETRYREVAQRAVETVAPVLAKHARFAGYAGAVAEALLSGPYEIAVLTREPVTDPLVRAAWRLAPPGAVIVAGTPDQPGVPLLARRPLRENGSSAYVCRGFVCAAPVATVEALAEQLAASPAEFERPE